MFSEQYSSCLVFQNPHLLLHHIYPTGLICLEPSSHHRSYSSLGFYSKIYSLYQYHSFINPNNNQMPTPYPLESSHSILGFPKNFYTGSFGTHLSISKLSCIGLPSQVDSRAFQSRIFFSLILCP